LGILRPAVGLPPWWGSEFRADSWLDDSSHLSP
jgi:hypothetical protein